MKYIISLIRELAVIFWDEITKIFSDAGVMLLLFGATLAYPLIYSVAYNPEVLTETPIAVVNKDGSQLSRTLVRMIDATSQIKVQKKSINLAQAKDEFFHQNVYGIVLIPSDFTKNIYSKTASHISVYADASYLMLYKQVYQGALMASQTLGKKIEIKSRLMHGVPLDKAVRLSNPVVYKSAPMFNPLGGYGSYAMPAILILIIQQTLLLSIGMRGGTARELGAPHYLIPIVASHKGSLRVILGKALAYLSLYVPISFYLLVLIPYWFKFPLLGSSVDVFLFSIPLLLSSILLGFLFTTFFRNRESSMIFILFTSIPFLFLSGFSWPVESFPWLYKYLAHLVPSTPGIIGYLKISVMGGSLFTARDQFVELWVMTIILFLINWLIANYRLKKSKLISNSQ